jgi:hypothetical protein
MEVLDVLQCKVLVLGEQFGTTVKDLASGRVLVDGPLQLRDCSIHVASETAPVTRILECLPHTAKLRVGLAFALDTAHGANQGNPNERNGP